MRCQAVGGVWQVSDGFHGQKADIRAPAAASSQACLSKQLNECGRCLLDFYLAYAPTKIIYRLRSGPLFFIEFRRIKTLDHPGLPSCG